MSQFWFTADTHFGHRNIIKYCQRPVMSESEQQQAIESPRGDWRVSDETVERHDQMLMDNINAVVAATDTLWILGDFCWGDFAAAKGFRDRIKCRNVNLVWGNHDKREIESLFGKTIEQGVVRWEGQKIWLNHYPMRS